MRHHVWEGRGCLPRPKVVKAGDMLIVVSTSSGHGNYYDILISGYWCARCTGGQFGDFFGDKVSLRMGYTRAKVGVSTVSRRKR